MNTRSAACVALGIVRRVTFQYRVMADKEELKTLFSLWQKVSRTITSFITLLFRSGLIIFVLLVIAFSVQAECHFGRVFGRRFCFVRIIWQNIRFDQTFLPKMPFCQILVSAETVTVTVLQFPSEVGPSAAGQCRLPDFGGKKLSQGDRLETMKLNKIICVARFTI